MASWGGSVVLSSTVPLAAVVNQLSGNAATLGSGFRFDSYVGIGSASAGTTILIPQALKNQFDPGTNITYNSMFAIQNTSGATAHVTVTFYGFPTGVYTDTTYVSPGISGYSSAFVDLQSNPALAGVSALYGSAKVTSDQPVAVIVNQNGYGSLATYLGYNPVTDAAQTLYLPQLLKNHYDPGTGLYYNTGILVMSADGNPANVHVTYYNSVDHKTYTSETKTANPATGFDQRTDPALTASWVYGTAVVTADRPVIVAVSFFANYNPSRGIRQVYYPAFTSSTSAGTMFAPVVLKNSTDAGSGVALSSGIVGQFMGSSPQTVTITYYYNDGTSATSTASVSPTSPQFGWDQRSDPNMTQNVASAVITCPEPIAFVAHEVGNNSVLGDAAGVYSGIK